eukprot:2741015-Rhodomonas_salina.1
MNSKHLCCQYKCTGTATVKHLNSQCTACAEGGTAPAAPRPKRYSATWSTGGHFSGRYRDTRRRIADSPDGHSPQWYHTVGWPSTIRGVSPGLCVARA